MKTTLSLPTLPAAITRYLDAANRFDAVTAADCFAPDASVQDENHHYVGRDVIRDWVTETSRKYHPAFTVVRTSVDEDDVNLLVAVSGQFPGSPVTLSYQFRLCDGKIINLTIE